MRLRSVFDEFMEVMRLGVKSIMLHKARASLTLLGVIFGVAAVIAMLSISEGMRYEMIERLKLLGINNILLESVKPPEKEKPQEEASGMRGSYLRFGLLYKDLRMIRSICPWITHIVPVKNVMKDMWYGSRRVQANILATLPEYTGIFDHELAVGRFLTAADEKRASSVCVMGADVARDCFANFSPLGKTVKIAGVDYLVVGKLLGRYSKAGDEDSSGMEVTDLNRSVYIPLSTARFRYGDSQQKQEAGSTSLIHQELDQIYVKVPDAPYVEETAARIRRVLEINHEDVDYRINVPLILLREKERTQRTFNIVMIAIASISLLVGGIGIMNIMLASVTERTREIGIRRAMGAKKRDITVQFLVETVVLSASGGLIGLLVGAVGAQLVSAFADWKTIVPMWAVFLGFGISAGTGIVFGMFPAIKAANMDPIEALRHE